MACLTASADVRKGEVVVKLGSPLTAFQTATSKRTALCCAGCLRFVGSLEEQFLLAAKSVRRSDVVARWRTKSSPPTKLALPACDIAAIGGSWKCGAGVACAAQGCMDVYCSDACRTQVASRHRRTCCGLAVSEESVADDSDAEAQTSSKEFCQFVTKCGRDDLLLAAEFLGTPVEQQLLQLTDRSLAPNCTLDDVLEDAWMLLSAACPALLQDSSAERFARLAHAIAKLIHFVNLPSPTREYCRALPEQSADVRTTASNALAPFARQVLGEEERRCAAHGSDAVQRERRLARIAQVADDSGTGGDGQDMFALSAAQVMAIVSQPLRHSCCPNCALVALPASAGAGPQQPLELGLAALRDLSANEPLTVAKIDISESHKGRWSKLRAAGLHESQLTPCTCDRCSFESGTASSWCEEAAASSRLRALAHLAMQQGRTEDALKLFNHMLRLKPDDGEALHGIFGAHVEAGNTALARKACAEGVRKAPDHALMTAQATRDAAYYPSPDAPLPDDVLPYATPLDPVVVTSSGWEEHRMSLDDAVKVGRKRKCKISQTSASSVAFVTLRPLLSKDECSWVIKTAEDHAASIGGWTTARHYAVPTTDVPLHTIPVLLRWFNAFLRDKLRPVLQAQYGPEMEFRCNDSFVVRYDADKGQRHLPLHVDQSTHSVTLALNGGDDFDGGGTYFPSLGRAFLAPTGHAFSFEGGRTPHQGDPVTRGVRYIIAVLLFAEAKDICATATKSANLEPTTKKSCGPVQPAQGVLRKWWSTESTDPEPAVEKTCEPVQSAQGVFTKWWETKDTSGTAAESSNPEPPTTKTREPVQPAQGVFTKWWETKDASGNAAESADPEPHTKKRCGPVQPAQGVFQKWW